jgi:hypothetical protein
VGIVPLRELFSKLKEYKAGIEANVVGIVPYSLLSARYR